MLDLEKTALHKVYKTEFLGDTLVVELQGDSPGFSVGAVHNEMATVIGLAKNPVVRHLVIDLSGSNYYGSVILGEIVNLGQAVREKGGRVALAGVSPDMKEILRMMRLDAMWERYPTRSMALRALADIPWQVKLKPWRKPAAYAGGVLLLLVVFFCIPRKDPAREYYVQVAKFWEEGERLRRVQASDTEWAILTTKAKDRMQQISARLERVYGNEAARHLLQATRDYAPHAFDQRLNPTDQDTIHAVYYLACSKAFLDQTPQPPPLEDDQTNAVLPGNPGMVVPGSPRPK